MFCMRSINQLNMRLIALNVINYSAFVSQVPKVNMSTAGNTMASQIENNMYALLTVKHMNKTQLKQYKIKYFPM